MRNQTTKFSYQIATNQRLSKRRMANFIDNLVDSESPRPVIVAMVNQVDNKAKKRRNHDRLSADLLNTAISDLTLNKAKEMLAAMEAGNYQPYLKSYLRRIVRSLDTAVTTTKK